MSERIISNLPTEAKARMVVLLFIAWMVATSSAAQTPLDQPVGTMKELMAKIVLPTSDAILYISMRTPEDEAGWNELQGKALMLAETANLMMLPSRARDQEKWLEDTRLMLDAGRAAFEAAKSKDVDALAALNDPLYTSCVTCHEDYSVRYGPAEP